MKKIFKLSIILALIQTSCATSVGQKCIDFDEVHEQAAKTYGSRNLAKVVFSFADGKAHKLTDSQFEQYLNSPDATDEFKTHLLIRKGLTRKTSKELQDTLSEALKVNAFRNEQEKAYIKRAISNSSKDIAPSPQTGTIIDAKPTVRIPAIIPARSKKSGRCFVEFDVSPAGNTENIRVLYCTDLLFELSTKNSVSKWQYTPKTINGKAVTRRGIRSSMHFVLTDACGREIPF